MRLRLRLRARSVAHARTPRQLTRTRHVQKPLFLSLADSPCPQNCQHCSRWGSPGEQRCPLADGVAACPLRFASLLSAPYCSHPSAGKASSNESVPDILALRSLNLSGGGEESPAGSPNSSAPSLSPRSPPTDEIFEADAAAEYQNMVKARSDAMRAFSAAPYP